MAPVDVHSPETSMWRLPNDLRAPVDFKPCKDYHVFSGQPHPDHDAFYCTRCYVWLDPKCEYSNCPYCKDRPLLAPVQE